MPKRIRKTIGRTVLVILILAITAGVIYAWEAFPIISGYGAKNMASAVFLQHRNPDDVLREDLAGFPFSLGRYQVNRADSSVTGSIWGLARQKAIYRRGVGCTLINGLTESEVRAQTFLLPPTPVSNRDSIPWPAGDLVSRPVSANIDDNALQNALSLALQATHEGKPAYTRAVVVVYDGKIVGERYAPGFDRNSLMLGWSVSKSLTSALIGILVNDGKLSVDSPAPVPEWSGTDRQGITVRHLLNQASGLDFLEDYTKPSEVTNMLFREGDMGAFTARRPLKHQPGTVFSYSSGNSNILSRIIRHTVGEQAYSGFPYSALFHRVGMYSALLEPDASGTYIGSSYSYATARDFARFGLLYLQNGVWNGDTILPTGWVAETVRPAPADTQKHYGFQFWLNGLSKEAPGARLFPDVPADLFYADGFGGQNIYIIPSKKLVVVRFGLQTINENELLRNVLKAVK
jgi:CubicO group peptidase (beta-lactamase class C family)